jgi:hypothetical protein
MKIFKFCFRFLNKKGVFVLGTIIGVIVALIYSTYTAHAMYTFTGPFYDEVDHDVFAEDDDYYCVVSCVYEDGYDYVMYTAVSNPLENVAAYYYTDSDGEICIKFDTAYIYNGESCPYKKVFVQYLFNSDYYSKNSYVVCGDSNKSALVGLGNKRLDSLNVYFFESQSAAKSYLLGESDASTATNYDDINSKDDGYGIDYSYDDEFDSDPFANNSSFICISDHTYTYMYGQRAGTDSVSSNGYAVQIRERLYVPYLSGLFYKHYALGYADNDLYALCRTNHDSKTYPIYCVQSPNRYYGVASSSDDSDDSGGNGHTPGHSGSGIILYDGVTIYPDECKYKPGKWYYRTSYNGDSLSSIKYYYFDTSEISTTLYRFNTISDAQNYVDGVEVDVPYSTESTEVGVDSNGVVVNVTLNNGDVNVDAGDTTINEGDVNVSGGGSDNSNDKWIVVPDIDINGDDSEDVSVPISFGLSSLPLLFQYASSFFAMMAAYLTGVPSQIWGLIAVAISVSIILMFVNYSH